MAGRLYQDGFRFRIGIVRPESSSVARGGKGDGGEGRTS